MLASPFEIRGTARGYAADQAVREPFCVSTDEPADHAVVAPVVDEADRSIALSHADCGSIGIPMAGQSEVVPAVLHRPKHEPAGCVPHVL